MPDGLLTALPSPEAGQRGELEAQKVKITQAENNVLEAAMGCNHSNTNNTVYYTDKRSDHKPWQNHDINKKAQWSEKEQNDYVVSNPRPACRQGSVVCSCRTGSS